MLVLTRKTNEAIIIGDDIELTVVEVRGNRVKLGINAPKHVPVMRQEVAHTVQHNRPTATADAGRATSIVLG